MMLSVADRHAHNRSSQDARFGPDVDASHTVVYFYLRDVTAHVMRTAESNR